MGWRGAGEGEGEGGGARGRRGKQVRQCEGGATGCQHTNHDVGAVREMEVLMSTSRNYNIFPARNGKFTDCSVRRCGVPEGG